MVFRKTLTIVCLIGLLLSVGLWVLSYFHVFYESSNMRHIGWISKGCVTWRIRQAYLPGHQTTLKFGGYSSLETTWWPSKTLGGNRLLGYRTDVLNVAVPMWLPTLVFGATALYLGLSNLLFRRPYRRRRGLCLECGYDLRASKERCPECGTVFGSAGVDELRGRTLPAKYK